MALAGDIGVELNLLCRKGHIVGPFEITWTSDTGVPIPLTGMTFNSVIWATPPTGVEAVALVDDPFAVTIVSAVNGVFSFVLLTLIADNLPVGILNYTLSMTQFGEKTPLFFGKLEVRFG